MSNAPGDRLVPALLVLTAALVAGACAGAAEQGADGALGAVSQDPLGAFVDPVAGPPAAEVRVLDIDTELVPPPAKTAVLLPPGYRRDADPYPLLLFLHGGGGDHTFLSERMKGLFEQAWAMGILRPLVVVTPSAGRSFYLDYRDGSERWESFILDELLPRIREQFNVVETPAGTLVGGISMGGMGSLRMAFKHPGRFAAVAALEPGIEPALSFDEIELEDRFWRSRTLFEERYGKPVDRAYWQANNPASIVVDRAAAVRDSGLEIYLEVGDQDSFNLHRGTEFLHRLLFDNGISHGYRLIAGADHLGATLPSRFLYAFAELDQALAPPPEDRSLQPLHRYIERLRRNAGLEP